MKAGNSQEIDNVDSYGLDKLGGVSRPEFLGIIRETFLRLNTEIFKLGLTLSENSKQSCFIAIFESAFLLFLSPPL